MIPDSWLQERLEKTSAGEISRREIMGLGLREADLQKLLASGPSPLWTKKWKEFLSRMIPGDELWSFKSPPETWHDLAGRAGYALVRAGQIVESVITLRS